MTGKEERVRLRGKTALVTGGARGIGKAIVRAFAAEGAAVFIADVEEREGAALASRLNDEGARAWFIRLDVTREADWVAALASVAERTGRLDILVNNAGINIREPIEAMSEANLDAMLAVNVKGPFLGIKCAIPLMRRGGGGVILNTSSVCGLIGHRFTPEAYTMMKGAVTLLSRAVAVRYAKEGIRCNSVNPCTVETDLVRTMLQDPSRRAERVGEVPLGRLATPEDVASAFVYLASDEAAFVNGVAFPVDGGLTAY